MVNNKEKGYQLKELMETLLEAVPELMRLLKEGLLVDFYQLKNDIEAALTRIKSAASVEEEEVYVEVEKIVYNCLASLERLNLYVAYNPEKALNKIEFELWPFLRTMHIQFYYFGLIYPDIEKMQEWNNGIGKELCKNYYIEKAEKTGKYKYDITILVTGYNKLEYTQLCVNKIIENLPKDIKCELILRNHGSTDGTKEFFEKICPTKQIDFVINRAGSNSTWFTYEGKYVLTVSNDVLITPNMIEVLYEAFEENEDYGYAVPVTPNVSNLQAPLQLKNGNMSSQIGDYKTISELEKVAKAYNKRDYRKEEVRYRLCNPLAFIRNKCVDLDTNNSILSIIFSQQALAMFPDDLLSMCIRRAGYKNVLMKDLYAHHYGSITIKDDSFKAKDYGVGRKRFLEVNGIDPWGHGFCWSYQLFDKLLCNKTNCKQILGINCGLGSNILKIQQELKEHTGECVSITSLTDCEKYIPDLFALTDLVLKHEGWNDIRSGISEMYDYILVDNNIGEEYQKNITKLYAHVVENGILIIFVPESREDIISWIKKTYVDVTITEKVPIAYEIDEKVTSDMAKVGYYLFWCKR